MDMTLTSVLMSIPVRCVGAYDILLYDMYDVQSVLLALLLDLLHSMRAHPDAMTDRTFSDSILSYL